MKNISDLNFLPKNFLQIFKKSSLPIIMGICGILLIFISSFLFPKSGSQDKKTVPNDAMLATETYISNIESKLKSIITEVDAVGEVEVMITLKSTPESLYVKEEKKNTDSSLGGGSNNGNQEISDDVENNVVIISEAGGGEKALVEKILEPDIKGVAVICTGGGSPLVQQRVTDIVTTVLGISSNRVCVIKKS